MERPYFSGRAGYQRRRHLPLPTGPQGLCSRNRIPYLGIMRAVLGGEKVLVFSMVRNRRRSIPCLVVARASPPLAAPPTSYSDWGGDIFFLFFLRCGKEGFPALLCFFGLGFRTNPTSFFFLLLSPSLLWSGGGCACMAWLCRDVVSIVRGTYLVQVEGTCMPERYVVFLWRYPQQPSPPMPYHAFSSSLSSRHPISPPAA